MTVILNYGLGNINAFVNIYKNNGIPIKIAQNSDELLGAKRIILPGVGSFDQAMTLFNKSGMRPIVDKLVLLERIPLLGICVGMQMLANKSEEGILNGLGYINGIVSRFSENEMSKKLNLPHMGWNNVQPKSNADLLKNLPENPLFYFLHSYYFECNNNFNSIAVADYGIEFTCAVKYNNIYGVQFHPEKSHQNGIQLLKNFALIS